MYWSLIGDLGGSIAVALLIEYAIDTYTDWTLEQDSEDQAKQGSQGCGAVGGILSLNGGEQAIPSLADVPNQFRTAPDGSSSDDDEDDDASWLLGVCNDEQEEHTPVTVAPARLVWSAQGRSSIHHTSDNNDAVVASSSNLSTLLTDVSVVEDDRPLVAPTTAAMDGCVQQDTQQDDAAIGQLVGGTFSACADETTNVSAPRRSSVVGLGGARNDEGVPRAHPCPVIQNRSATSGGVVPTSLAVGSSPCLSPRTRSPVSVPSWLGTQHDSWASSMYADPASSPTQVSLSGAGGAMASAYKTPNRMPITTSATTAAAVRRMVDDPLNTTQFGSSSVWDAATTTNTSCSGDASSSSGIGVGGMPVRAHTSPPSGALELNVSSESCVAPGGCSKATDPVEPQPMPQQPPPFQQHVIVLDLDFTLLVSPIGELRVPTMTVAQQKAMFVEAAFLRAFCARADALGHLLSIASFSDQKYSGETVFTNETAGSAHSQRRSTSTCTQVIRILDAVLPPTRLYLCNALHVVCHPALRALPYDKGPHVERIIKNFEAIERMKAANHDGRRVMEDIAMPSTTQAVHRVGTSNPTQHLTVAAKATTTSCEFPDRQSTISYADIEDGCFASAMQSPQVTRSAAFEATFSEPASTAEGDESEKDAPPPSPSGAAVHMPAAASGTGTSMFRPPFNAFTTSAIGSRAISPSTGCGSSPQRSPTHSDGLGAGTPQKTTPMHHLPRTSMGAGCPLGDDYDAHRVLFNGSSSDFSAASFQLPSPQRTSNGPTADGCHLPPMITVQTHISMAPKSGDHHNEGDSTTPTTVKMPRGIHRRASNAESVDDGSSCPPSSFFSSPVLDPSIMGSNIMSSGEHHSSLTQGGSAIPDRPDHVEQQGGECPPHCASLSPIHLERASGDEDDSAAAASAAASTLLQKTSSPSSSAAATGSTSVLEHTTAHGVAPPRSAPPHPASSCSAVGPSASSSKTHKLAIPAVVSVEGPSRSKAKSPCFDDLPAAAPTVAILDFLLDMSHVRTLPIVLIDDSKANCSRTLRASCFQCPEGFSSAWYATQTKLQEDLQMPIATLREAMLADTAWKE